MCDRAAPAIWPSVRSVPAGATITPDAPTSFVAPTGLRIVAKPGTETPKMTYAEPARDGPPDQRERLRWLERAGLAEDAEDGPTGAAAAEVEPAQAFERIEVGRANGKEDRCADCKATLRAVFERYGQCPPSAFQAA